LGMGTGRRVPSRAHSLVRDGGAAAAVIDGGMPPFTTGGVRSRWIERDVPIASSRTQSSRFSAVPISTTHTIGGKGVAKAPMASDTAAIAKARTSRFLENLRVSDDDGLTLVGCSSGSGDGLLLIVCPKLSPECLGNLNVVSYPIVVVMQSREDRNANGSPVRVARGWC
jgi:hypothetical protein